jgi:hypothetical protein
VARKRTIKAELIYSGFAQVSLLRADGKLFLQFQLEDDKAETFTAGWEGNAVKVKKKTRKE